MNSPKAISMLSDFFGMYIGNFPDLLEEEVLEIIDLVNSAVS